MIRKRVLQFPQVEDAAGQTSAALTPRVVVKTGLRSSKLFDGENGDCGLPWWASGLDSTLSLLEGGFSPSSGN